MLDIEFIIKNNITDPIVSVILPTYNREHLIKRAIVSVLNQSYQNFELIIVDDASTDNTYKIVNAFGNARISYIRHLKNKGAAEARNTGLKLSKGRFIAFQDSDDEWLPTKLEQQVQLLSQSSAKIGGVYSSFWQIKEGKKYLFPSKLTKLASYLPATHRKLEGNIHQSLLRGNLITLQTVLLKKDCFEKVGLFDKMMPPLEDWEFFLRFSKHYHFIHIKNPLVNLYCTSNSISTNQTNLIQALNCILEKYSQAFETNNMLLGHYLYATGDILYQTGHLKQGQQNFIKAVKLAPLNIIYWLVTFLSLLGHATYVKAIKFLNIGYVR